MGALWRRQRSGRGDGEFSVWSRGMEQQVATSDKNVGCVGRKTLHSPRTLSLRCFQGLVAPPACAGETRTPLPAHMGAERGARKRGRRPLQFKAQAMQRGKALQR